MKKIYGFIKEKKYLTMGAILFLIAVFIIGNLWEFNNRIYENEYRSHLNLLEELSQQGSQIVEKQLTGYVQELTGISMFFPEGELHTEENMKKLKKVAGEFGFQRIGLADSNGTSVLTNGKTLDISSADYFVQVMEGEKVITELKDSRIKDAKIFIVAVPIYDKKQEARGVLYGVVEIDSFDPYKNTSMQSEFQYVQVIDINGAYIMKSDKNSVKITEDNIFERLKKFTVSMDEDEIKGKMAEGEVFYLEVDEKEEEFLGYFAPLQTDNWYVVTILSKNHITDEVDDLLEEDLQLFLTKMAAAVVLLCIVIVYFFRREKIEIEELYQKLKVNDKLLRGAISTSKNGVFIYDIKEDKIRIVNNADRLGNFPPEVEHVTKKLLANMPQDEKTRRQIEEMQAGIKKLDSKAEYEFTVDSKEEGVPAKNFVIHVEVQRDQRGNAQQCVGIVEDVTENRYLKTEMELRERLLAGIVGFMVIDLGRDKILHLSKKMSEYCGQGECYSEALSGMLMNMVNVEYRNYIGEFSSPDKLLENFRNGIRICRGEYIADDVNGEKYWMESEIRLEEDEKTGACIAYISLKNIDDKKKNELLLRQEAERDYLTGLYNRRRGMTMIEQRLKKQKNNTQNKSAFVMIDLDNFKTLNDTLGHQTGDKALKDAARIMQRHFREYDVICRLAGDEFVVFLVDIPETVIRRNIEILLKKLCLTYGKEKEVSISASAGIAVCPDQGTDLKVLYEKADKALYKAKRSGKNSVEFYQA